MARFGDEVGGVLLVCAAWVVVGTCDDPGWRDCQQADNLTSRTSCTGPIGVRIVA